MNRLPFFHSSVFFIPFFPFFLLYPPILSLVSSPLLSSPPLFSPLVSCPLLSSLPFLIFFPVLFTRFLLFISSQQNSLSFPLLPNQIPPPVSSFVFPQAFLLSISSISTTFVNSRFECTPPNRIKMSKQLDSLVLLPRQYCFFSWECYISF